MRTPDPQQPTPQATDSLNAAKEDRRNARIDFWFGSVARATLLLYASTFLIMTAFSVYSDVQADGFSFGRVVSDALAAGVWSFILVLGSCYFSIPLGTLVVAAVRGLRRHLRRRHTSSQEPEPPANGVAPQTHS